MLNFILRKVHCQVSQVTFVDEPYSQHSLRSLSHLICFKDICAWHDWWVLQFVVKLGTCNIWCEYSIILFYYKIRYWPFGVAHISYDGGSTQTAAGESFFFVVVFLIIIFVYQITLCIRCPCKEAVLYSIGGLHLTIQKILRRLPYLA